MAHNSVESTSYILVPDGVEDLDDFVANRSRYLVSIDDEPQRAADLWKDRLTRHPYGSEGLVELKYHGRDLIPAYLWDEVSGIWFELVQAVAGFLEHGTGEATFPGSPAEIKLERRGRSALFTVHTTQNVVDPAELVQGLLAEAQRYYRWAEQYIGLDESVVLDQIEGLLERARS